MKKQTSKKIGQQRYAYDEVDSTNERAKQLAKEKAPEGTLVIAECQTKGKGRNGRIWQSDKGVGLWMSIILRPDLPIQKVQQVTLVAGLAMCETIRELTHLDVMIKWPNDLVIQGKKVCGILCELKMSKQKVDYIIVGIGVNVNTKSFDDGLPYATSLYLESGKTSDREAIINCFCNRFEHYYEHFKTTQTMAMLKSSYERYCININREVKIINNQQEYTAYAQGITDEGALIVDKKDGTRQNLTSGDLSVRGVYGYCD